MLSTKERLHFNLTSKLKTVHGRTHNTAQLQLKVGSSQVAVT